MRKTGGRHRAPTVPTVAVGPTNSSGADGTPGVRDRAGTAVAADTAAGTDGVAGIAGTTEADGIEEAAGAAETVGATRSSASEMFAQYCVHGGKAKMRNTPGASAKLTNYTKRTNPSTPRRPRGSGHSSCQCNMPCIVDKRVGRKIVWGDRPRRHNELLEPTSGSRDGSCGRTDPRGATSDSNKIMPDCKQAADCHGNLAASGHQQHKIPPGNTRQPEILNKR